ncbi:NAD(P)H-dependent oxidoreductase [Rhodohalobacter sp. SW132]|uniref:NAD(P)H-dependent oxidoreductase n=1 Tax=Rhodohalobacter sp. SW132 TaxID=2293433 RepID=UPI000E24DD11|nr:NAD(P)H-dependent oxidoreductase [Rhodohalobacter sp. SW132]REL38108.1 NAD(P)H-dependent oxidoreductase [Rhodohalobacter sp. SW132]
MKILGISGSLSQQSKTELAVKQALNFAEEFDRDLETDLVSLSSANLVFCDGRNPDQYEGDSRTVLDKIIEADAIIAGSPIYRGTFSGAFKNLFDLIPNDALKGKAIGIVATGGSDHHFLAIEHQFKPLFGYFNSFVVPAGVYANNGHFTNGSLSDADVKRRLKELAEETVRLSTRLNQRYIGPTQPEIKRESLQTS